MKEDMNILRLGMILSFQIPMFSSDSVKMLLLTMTKPLPLLILKRSQFMLMVRVLNFVPMTVRISIYLMVYLDIII
jgi:hypothetical protein